MPDYKKDLAKLEAMVDGDVVYINWYDGGGGKVTKEHGIFTLYEVTSYGSNEYLEGTYAQEQLIEMLDLAYTWT